MAYIIYCDESADKGEKFRDFFGGCIINSKDQFEITSALEAKKKDLMLEHEVKWTRVTENYLHKYIELIDLFFDYIQSGKIKVRIMFRATDDSTANISDSAVDDKYFKLYYQFLKHSFGLMHIPKECTPTNIIIYLDVLPDKHGKREEFKEFIHAMPKSMDFNDSDITIRSRDIIEVDSKNHVLLQCTDIVLGAMNFKLNGFDKVKPAGQAHRGKRTIAKEKLYKHILERIREIHPNFNVGVSTGDRGYSNPHWESPYEHWLFRANKNA
jgi:hypothetical protein